MLRTFSEQTEGYQIMRIMRQVLEGAAFGTLMAMILVGQHLLQ